MQTPEGPRAKSYGESYHPTLVDGFGAWLSARQTSCFRTVLEEATSVTLAEVSLTPDPIAHPKVKAIDGRLPEALKGFGRGRARCGDVRFLPEACLGADGRNRGVPPAARARRRAPVEGALLARPAFSGIPGASSKNQSSRGFGSQASYYAHDPEPLAARTAFNPSAFRSFAPRLGLNTFAADRTNS
jgi:hypothetical protein